MKPKLLDVILQTHQDTTRNLRIQISIFVVFTYRSLVCYSNYNKEGCFNQEHTFVSRPTQRSVDLLVNLS